MTVEKASGESGTWQGDSEVTKITFQVNHPPSRPQRDDVNVQMYLVGSLKALGSWDHDKGRRMTRAFDKGQWSLTVYVPQSAEFLYQYVLKDHESGAVLWESSLERKQSTISNSATMDIHDNISEQEDATSSAAIQERQQAMQQQAGGGPPMPVEEDTASIAIASAPWEHDDEYEDTRESLLPAPTFSVTKQLTGSPAQGLHNKVVAAAKNGIMSPAMQRGVKEIGNWVSKALTNPQQQQQEMRLQDANERIHNLLQDRERLEEENRMLREQQEDNMGVLSKERILAEDAQRELVQEKEAEQMRARRIRKTLRANSSKFAEAREGLKSLKIEMSSMQAESTSLFNEFSRGIAKLAVGSSSTELDDLKKKLQQETAIRRQLHNQVMELKGNIRVMCRVRPASQGQKVAVNFLSDQELSLNTGGKVQPFSYDRVFTPESTQEEVYEETRPLVSSALDGYNVSVFAYGQTGSGKTHTMGMMNSRALEDLFKIADEKRMIARYDFKLSAIEIYNEQVRDLLEPNDASGKQKKLDVKTDAATGASTVPDMLHSPCTSINDVDRLMDQATRNRTSASTSMNQHSSRSHLILTVHITRIDLVNGGTLFGKLHLIDLAGSERLSRTGAEGDRLTEAKNINKSLSALGNCISALVTKSKHVPYRDSKLTFLLQDSLGMDSKTLMFVCASPAEADVTETICSFQFAARVSKVELGAAKKRGDGGASIMVKEAELKAKKAEEERNMAMTKLEELQAEKNDATGATEKALAKKEAMLEERERAIAEREAALESKLRGASGANEVRKQIRKDTSLVHSSSNMAKESDKLRNEIEAKASETSGQESDVEEAEQSCNGFSEGESLAGVAEEEHDHEREDKENTQQGEQKEQPANPKDALSLEARLAMFRARKEDARKRQERIQAARETQPQAKPASNTVASSPRVSKRTTTSAPLSTSSSANKEPRPASKSNVTKPKPFSLSSRGSSRPRTAPVSASSTAAGWR